MTDLSDSPDFVLAHAVLAAVSREGLIQALDRIDDGLNHPLVVACVVAFGAALAIATIASLSIWYWRCTHHALRRLRLIPVAELPVAFRLATARTVPAATAQLVHDPVPFAFTRGWLRPTIIISSALVAELSPDELDAVLLHERAHAVRRDPLRAVIARAAAKTFAIVPGSSGLARAYLCRLELVADASVVAIMRSPVPLASALHRLLNAGYAKTMPGMVGLSPTDVRIDRLLGEATPLRSVIQPPSLTHVLMFALGVMLLAALVLASAHSVSTCIFGASGSSC